MQPDDPHILHDGHAPTPFTAAEIRAGCPQGRTITLSVDGEGGSLLKTIRFVAVDPEGADQESFATTREGEPLGEPSSARTSWIEFQEHASFPAEATVVEAEALALESYEARRALQGPEHSDTLTAMVDLATTYAFQGRFDEAEPLFVEALEIARRTLGPNHALTSTAMKTLGLV